MELTNNDIIGLRAGDYCGDCDMPNWKIVAQSEHEATVVEERKRIAKWLKDHNQYEAMNECFRDLNNVLDVPESDLDHNREWLAIGEAQWKPFIESLEKGEWPV